MSRSIRFLLLLIAVLFAAGASHAATVDPLLRRLLDVEAGKSPRHFQLERLIVIDREKPDGRTRVGVILHLDGALPDLSEIDGLVVGSTVGGLATARLPLDELAALAAVPGIAHVSAAGIARPSLDLAVPASNVDPVWSGTPAYTGQGVLVGVIDTGIDIRHPDFRTPDGHTRIAAIWDVFDTTGDPPAGFVRGSEYTRDRIDAAILGGDPVGGADNTGHGSHVTGIAAGNGRASDGLYRGPAYASEILVAKPYSDGFPMTETIDAMTYLVGAAQDLGRPIVINMSLGTQFGSYDGTSAQEIAIDALSGPGVVFCVAAGNNGDTSITWRGPADGSEFELRIPEYDPVPGADNDYALLTIWYDGDTEPEIGISAGGVSVGPIASGEQDYDSTPLGALGIDNASEGADPANGDKLCMIRISDASGIDVAETVWTVTVDGGLGTLHARVAYRTMPAYFPGSDQGYSLDSPSTAAKAISVAAYKTRQTWTSLAGERQFGGASGDAEIGARAPFSAIGPTRDERLKPDISAPGLGIISALSSDPGAPQVDELIIPGRDYQISAGTSMAAPVVSGVVAMMFEKNQTLGAVDVLSILRQTAARDDRTGPEWSPGYGAGKLDAFAALAAVEDGNADFGGDVDGNGVLDVEDIALLASHILDPLGTPLDTEQREIADAFPVGDGDGFLDVSDVVRLVAYDNGATIVGAPSTAPDPATLLRGAPYRRDGMWWFPVTLGGADLSGCQFTVEMPDADWLPAAPRHDGPVSTVIMTGSAAGLLRVLAYDTSGRLPAAGLTLELPFHGTWADKAVSGVDDVLAVAPYGYPRLMTTRTSGHAPPAILFLEASPNPSAGPVSIAYQLSIETAAEVEIFDIRGRLVRRHRNASPGLAQRTWAWDGEDADGRRAAAGVYLSRLSAGGEVMIRKIALSR